MAIFASTTTSGYSDPMKAMSIKALEQRMKDQQAQMAAQQPDTASMATIPGGIGHVLGVVGDKMAQGRAEQEVAAGRQELSSIIAQGPKGPNGQWAPEQMAVLARRSPELMEKFYQQQHDTEQQNARFGQETAQQSRLFGHQDAAAKEAARVAEIAKGQEDTAIRARDAQKALDAEVAATAQENRIQSRPTQDDLVLAKRAFERGEINQEEYDLRKKKLTAASPSEEKLIIGEREKAVEYQSTLKQLDKAFDLINSPEGIHSGNAITTPLKTGIGSVIPQSLGGPNDKTQANTMEFNRIMKSQGLQNLLAMKGASSDKDVTLNLEIANDPKEPLDRRKNALNIARNKLYTIAKANEEDLKRIGGEYPRLQAAPGGEDKNAAAKAWLANPANKNNPDYEAVRQKVEGK